MRHFLIFAGTTEGRLLADALSRLGAKVSVSVATVYGKNLIPKDERIEVSAQRRTKAQMVDWFQTEKFDAVIDATHPYATEVTQNVKTACKTAEVRYLRLLRESSGIHDCIYVDSTQAAIEYLNTTTGNVLLTIGSKELSKYTAVKQYRQRIYPRVLPTVDALVLCAELGFSSSQVIAMQGPFTEEMNIAMLTQISADYLVTKESGDIGGFEQKLNAAKKAGAKVIVTGRPVQEQGLSMEEIIQDLTQRYGLYGTEAIPRFFPLFIDLREKKVVVVGAGTVAQRRLRTLCLFGCDITLISPSIQETLTKMARITALERVYQSGDCKGATLVVAATNNRAVNHQVQEDCKALGIPVSVADNREECSFYFPAVISEDNVVIGVTASGENHAQARRIAENIRAFHDVLMEE